MNHSLYILQKELDSLRHTLPFVEELIQVSQKWVERNHATVDYFAKKVQEHTEVADDLKIKIQQLTEAIRLLREYENQKECLQC